MYPLGAWEYHSDLSLIANADPKPLRIFINANEMDNGAGTAESGHRNWVMANQLTAAALKAKSYHYRFVFGMSAGHVRAAQKYIQEGKRVVVDIDLEKFFDRVNHDVLMGKLAKRIGDKRMLGLIRRYLNAGIMANGMVMERHEGTPQGGPLSPLMS